MRKVIYFVSLSVVLAACSKNTAPSSSDSERYKEDISVYRPRYTKPADTPDTVATEVAHNSNVKPTNDVTQSLNGILDSIDVARPEVNYIDGFTIQVYSGSNSESARIARGKVYSVLPGAEPILKFEEPNFKVKVGKYYSRIEAQKSFAKIKKKFPSALIIPQRITIQ